MTSSREYTWHLATARVTFDVSAASDRGLVRKINEDSFVAEPPLFLVADGMGGHAYGDRASQATADALVAVVRADVPSTTNSVLEAVVSAGVAVRSISDDEIAGSTLAGVALVQDRSDAQPHWLAFNIGDSRVYSWDGVVLAQVSIDHSAVQEMVDEGVITSVEAMSHPDRNVITRAIGISGDLEPDVWLLPAGGLQTFLICSDGLTKELDDATIGSVLTMPSDVPPADRLVAAALAAGGSDNVTVVVVQSQVTPPAADPAASESAEMPAHLQETLPRP